MARPPGSKNLEYRYVRFVPASCGWCESTRVRVMETETLNEHGTYEGRRFTRRVWRRVRCVVCGQVTVNHGYEFDASQWQS